jgi:rubrerythrin
MSRYPDDMQISWQKSQQFHCNDCDYTWGVSGIVDCGSWEESDENDIKCPLCNKEGE